MRRIAYRFLAAIRVARVSEGTGALTRPSRAKLGCHPRPGQLSVRHGLFDAVLVTSMIASMIASTTATATAETRPHYGGTLRVMMQSAPLVLDLPANAAPADYWDLARTLSLV